MDEKVFQLASQMGVTVMQSTLQMGLSINQNLGQGLGVIHDLQIQAQAGVQDDPAVFGALATSARVPDSGAIKGS
jgi:hypothetical protein